VESALAEYISHAPVFVRRMDGEIIYWTRGAEELYGFSAKEAFGLISHELLQTKFPIGLSAIETRLIAQGQWRGRLRHVARGGREIWTESVWRLRDNEVVVEQSTDITERMELERHRELLTQELDHRVKNTLSVVQGLARLSFGSSETENLRRFEDRLTALSKAHDILTTGHWERGRLKDIILDVSRAIGVHDRIRLNGPDAELRPRATVAYALAFHELCTNALKHGALRSPDGRIDITWDIGEQDRLHLVWRETGGPPVEPPEREGFGTRLIRSAVASELGTPVDLRYERGGLICEFGGPL
jgi:two-component system, chemotaxis family, CheB/CheR fusion protein